MVEAMTHFDSILARAQLRKGGAQALNALLPALPDPQHLKQLCDDRILAEMSKRVFCAGFSWTVIDNKWPEFETVFLGFNPDILAFQPNEFWDALFANPRIVRNAAKILSVRDNASFVREIASEHGSFGQFLSAWPSARQIELLNVLNERGSRLGGNTGQMFLRYLGWDGFVLSNDVVTCLRAAGLDIGSEVKSKNDQAKVQAQFNAWAEETGFSYTHLSKICALSIGENNTTAIET